MSRIRGIGGVFFRSRDPEAQGEWYRKHLGVPVGEGCAVFRWREHGDPSRERSTIWSPFPKDTDYFGDGGQELMINYIVDSLEDTLAELRQDGVRVEEHVEESEFGRFGWCYDPEGNRIELWEPPR